ncbi:hypothetical protein APY94_11105 [Thermococcus celericrescens]|uniref:Uncharacterized protein n=1 Tax=Thermococcus celericrescens TaxID=227598 RepID=A0A117IT88_9EURY|nr:hypothetical protein [Thermococcus celericrescens]KUH32055.1 hypothetical protein APY94_11105 [Thermococcus celericrescens]
MRLIPIEGIVLDLDVLDLPEFQGLLDEHFALLTIPQGIVLPDIRNHEESLHPDIVRSFKTGKSVKLILTAVGGDNEIGWGEDEENRIPILLPHQRVQGGENESRVEGNEGLYKA